MIAQGRCTSFSQCTPRQRLAFARRAGASTGATACDPCSWRGCRARRIACSRRDGLGTWGSPGRAPPAGGGSPQERSCGWISTTPPLCVRGRRRAGRPPAGIRAVPHAGARTAERRSLRRRRAAVFLKNGSVDRRRPVPVQTRPRDCTRSAQRTGMQPADDQFSLASWSRDMGAPAAPAGGRRREAP